MGMNENECTIDVGNIWNLLLLPQQGANLLNPNYVTPDSHPGGFSVEIQYGSSIIEASPAPTTTTFTLTSGTLFATAKYVEIINLDGSKDFRAATFVGANVTVTPALPSAPDAGSIVLGWSQFTWHVIGKSISIDKVYGERGGANLSLYNDGTMPFIPPPESKIRLRNYPDLSYVYFAGYLKNPNPDFIRQRDNLTEKQTLEMECYDLYRELERQNIQGEVFVNQKAGAILKYLIRKYTTLDSSGIDGTAGPTFARYACDNSFVSQEVERLMKLTGWTFWIDSNTEQFLCGEPGSANQQILTVTDANIQQIFLNNEIKISPNYSGIRTRCVMNWTIKYATGTCNVSNGNSIVLGYADTFWDNLPSADMKFQVDGSDAVYTVNKNNSAGVTQELRLSQPYADNWDGYIGRVYISCIVRP